MKIKISSVGRLIELDIYLIMGTLDLLGSVRQLDLSHNIVVFSKLVFSGLLDGESLVLQLIDRVDLSLTGVYYSQ